MPCEYDQEPDAAEKLLPSEYDLYELMAEVTEENLHECVDFGRPVGKELL